MSPAGCAKSLSGQKTWLDYGLPDLRPLPRELRLFPPSEVAAAANIEAAIACLAAAFGLMDAVQEATAMTTPIGEVMVMRDKLIHIVEKRQDARERYVNFAIDTLQNPFEVWRVAYDNGNHRLAFISAYEGKRQMLVVVETLAGEVLWNFMHCDAKSLNKHRHGLLLYQRYQLED